MDDQADRKANEQMADAVTASGTPPAQSAHVDSGSRRLRWIGRGAAVLGVGLVAFGGLGFLSASSDHSSRDAANNKRRSLHAAQVRADAALGRAQRAADAVTSKVNSLASSSMELTNAGNAVVDAFNAAITQSNNGDTAGSQAAFQAQAGPVAALDGKLAAVRQALSQAQQQLATLQAEEHGR